MLHVRRRILGIAVTLLALTGLAVIGTAQTPPAPAAGRPAAPAQAAPAPATPVQAAAAQAFHRTWSRTYGGPVSTQGLHDLRQLPGGRLVVAGHTASFGGPSSFNWLLGLDLATGDVRVERASSSVFGGFTDGAAVASDGGALFLGRDVLDVFIKHDAWMVRVDATGRPVWSLGFTSPGAGKHFLFDAAELIDGSWIAVGVTSVLDQPPQSAWVVRVSAAGDLLWQHEYSAGLAETARAVTPTTDGGFAIAGWTNSSGAGSDDVWVMKVDANGTPEWQTTVGGADDDQAESIVELGDGSLGVAGSTDSFTASGHAPWVMRLSSGGKLIWHQIVDDDSWGDLGGISKTQDGQLVVVGRIAEPGFPTNDLWSAKFATDDGTIAWQRAYEGKLGDFGSVVIPVDTTGFVLGGTWAWGFPGESIWLQRTDRAGGLFDCNLVRATTFKPVSPAVSVQAGQALPGPGSAQLKQVPVQAAASHAEVTDVCQ